jgi:uncharacterized protein with NRDE domain
LPGVYGLSNAALDTPWPKTLRLKRALDEALGAGPTPKAAGGGAGRPRHPPASELPVHRRAGRPGARLSSPFVDMAERGYGTRSSLLLNVVRTGHGFSADFTEWTHAPPPAGPHRWTDAQPRRLRLA